MPEQSPSTETDDPSTVAYAVGLNDKPNALNVTIRRPRSNEGALFWELARDAGGLDLNSPYAYMMTCRNFQDTCILAEVKGQPAGFVMGHLLPYSPDTLFIWQVGVLDQFRGLGLAKRMLNGLLERDSCQGVKAMQSTVTPSNTASAALFMGFARDKGAQLTIHPGFSAEDFPKGQAHDPEDLFIISPLTENA